MDTHFTQVQKNARIRTAVVGQWSHLPAHDLQQVAQRHVIMVFFVPLPGGHDLQIHVQHLWFYIGK
jgi:hypothetical protein